LRHSKKTDVAELTVVVAEMNIPVRRFKKPWSYLVPYLSSIIQKQKPQIADFAFWMT